MRIREAYAWLVWLILAVPAMQDGKSCLVDGRHLAAAAGAGVLGTVWEAAAGGGSVIQPEAFLPGILLYAVGSGGEEIVGRGDALAVWSLGFGLPAADCLAAASRSIGMTAVCGIWMVLAGGRSSGDENLRIPYIPFLWLSLLEILLTRTFIR